MFRVLFAASVLRTGNSVGVISDIRRVVRCGCIWVMCLLRGALFYSFVMYNVAF